VASPAGKPIIGLPSRYKGGGEGKEGRGRKGLGIRGEEGGREGREGEGRDGDGREGNGWEKTKGGKRIGKGEGELDFEICPGAPEFLYLRHCFKFCYS